MADSRRINTNIHEEEAHLPEEEQRPVPLSAMILSSEFWPQLKEEKVELPASISKSMETYTRRFEKLKVSFSSFFFFFSLTIFCFEKLNIIITFGCWG